MPTVNLKINQLPLMYKRVSVAHMRMAEKAQDRQANAAKKFAQSITPVRTGRMRRSWFVSKPGLRRILRNLVPYSFFIWVLGRSKKLPRGGVKLLEDFIRKNTPGILKDAIAEAERLIK